jgi:starch synthase
MRRRIPNPYAETLEEAVGDVVGPRRAWSRVLHAVGPYLATPLLLLARYLRMDRCRAVLCQEYENPRFDLAVVLGRLLGIPVFGTFQGGDSCAPGLQRRVRPLALGLCAGVIAASSSERSRLAREYSLSGGKVHGIFNPVGPPPGSPSDRAAARRGLGVSEGARVVAWHGRVQWTRKGLDVLMDGWRQICAARPLGPEVLTLMGTGPDAPRLRAAAAGLPAGRVCWVDQYVSDRRRVAEFLHAADVYAFPSRHEGMPVAPLEAMACGLPVVASRAPGVEDILEADEPGAGGGVLVEPEDPRALAGALVTLLHDDPLRERTAMAARRRIDSAFSRYAVGARLGALLIGPPEPGPFTGVRAGRRA